jgi:hypothetical protein
MPVIAGGNIIGDAPDYQFADAGGDSPSGFRILQECLAGTGAFRQGALNLQINRAAAQADTSWDGNPDAGLKIIATNRATGNSAATGAVRAFDAQARNRGTIINWVNAANLNARNDSGMTAESLWGLLIRIENYGTVNTDIVGIDVNLSDENDTGSHTKTGILVRNTDLSGQAAVNEVLKISHTSTNGFTYLLNFAGTSGESVSSGSLTDSGATDVACDARIAIVWNGTPYWLPLFNTAA